MIQAETLGNPWDILNAILGHKYYQNHLDRVIIIRSSEWIEHLQQKWLIQSVNGRVLGTQSIVLPTWALGKCAQLLRRRN